MTGGGILEGMKRDQLGGFHSFSGKRERYRGLRMWKRRQVGQVHEIVGG